MIHAFTDSPHFSFDTADHPEDVDPRTSERRRTDRGGSRGPAVEAVDDVLAWFSLSLAWWRREGGPDPLARLSLTAMGDGPAGWRGGLVPARWM